MSVTLRSAKHTFTPFKITLKLSTLKFGIKRPEIKVKNVCTEPKTDPLMKGKIGLYPKVKVNIGICLNTRVGK